MRRWLHQNFADIDCDQIEISFKFTDPLMADRVQKKITAEVGAGFKASTPVKKIVRLLGFKVRFE